MGELGSGGNIGAWKEKFPQFGLELRLLGIHLRLESDGDCGDVVWEGHVGSQL